MGRYSQNMPHKLTPEDMKALDREAAILSPMIAAGAAFIASFFIEVASALTMGVVIWSALWVVNSIISAELRKENDRQ